MDNPVGEWTIRQAREICKRQGSSCRHCPFNKNDNGCIIQGLPVFWEYIDQPTTVTAAAKPRLAEVLVMEVGGRIKIAVPGRETTAWFIMNADGALTLSDDENGNPLGGFYLAYAINHPESIIRAPRLTETELEGLRWLAKWGVKYVSRDVSADDATVDLWNTMPDKVQGRFDVASSGGLLGRLDCDMFPSIRPGDCTCIEEAVGK